MLGFRIAEMIIDVEEGEQFIVEGNGERFECIMRSESIMIKEDNSYRMDHNDKVLNGIINGKLKKVD